MLRFPQLLAFAQLMRLPNVFTAFADICLAGAVTGAITQKFDIWLVILMSSGSLYLSGMIWNDVFDRHEDARTQPFRPIPSGRIKLRFATILGVVFMLTGLGLAYCAWDIMSQENSDASTLNTPFSIAVLLAGFILLYDVWLKWTPIGPIGMGACRFLNVLLGLSVSGSTIIMGDLSIHLAGVVGVYIVGVTWFARTEETDSNRRSLILAACVMLLSLAIALLLPLYQSPGESVWFFPYLLVLFGFRIGIPLATAIRHRDPNHVQFAVKRCILGLVFLDAILATAFVGLPGLLILLLLLPARILGRWVYST